jgi:hypothetical protein
VRFWTRTPFTPCDNSGITAQAPEGRSVARTRNQKHRFLRTPSKTPPGSLVPLFRSLQLRILGLGLLQDGDVGIGVFPEGEEIFVGGDRPDASGIGIRSL